MYRRHEKEGQFLRHIFTFNAPDRDEYLQTFPQQMPAGYKLAYKWNDDLTELQVWPEKIGEEKTVEVKPEAKSSKRVAELEAMKMEDLQTLAGQYGIDYPRQFKPAQTGEIKSRLAAQIEAKERNK